MENGFQRHTIHCTALGVNKFVFLYTNNMKYFWTWRKLALFFGIIGLGIIGLMIADQYDFLMGRNDAAIPIGNGAADPLVSGTVSPRDYIQPGTSKNPSNEIVPTSIDGIKKPR